MDGGSLAASLGFLPARRCRPESHVSALLWGHGEQSPLAAYLAALSPHGGHDAGYLRLRNLGRVRLRIGRSGRTADHLVGGLIYVRGAGVSA